jgi:hypothetical protein
VKRLIIAVGCDATLQTRQFNRKGLYTIDGRRLERLNPRYTYGPENRDAFFNAPERKSYAGFSHEQQQNGMASGLVLGFEVCLN